EYPAAREVVKKGEGLAVVNELPLEDYLVGVLRDDRLGTQHLERPSHTQRTEAVPHRRLDGPSGLRRAGAVVLARLGRRPRHARPGAPVGEGSLPGVLPLYERRVYRGPAARLRGAQPSRARGGPADGLDRR